MIRSFLLLLTLLLAGCGQPKAKLNLFIWSEYIPADIIADFEKQFDCAVTVDLYEDPDSMVAKLTAGGVDLYDIVVPSDTTLPGMVKRGLLAPLRRENIPNLKNIAPEFANPAFDPGNQYGAPCQWGTAGIYIRRPPGTTVDTSWGLIFDPARQPGPFLLLEDLRACIGAALRFKGYGLNSTNPVELAEARDLLVETKRRSLGFEGGTGCKNRVLAKGATLAMAYNGDSTRGMREDPETFYFVPREGSQLWMDTLSIPAKAPHRDLAEKFINYILDPKIGARLSNANQLATPNQAAREFIKPSDLQDPAIYPPPEIRRLLEYSADLGPHNRLYDELWTQIKAR